MIDLLLILVTGLAIVFVPAVLMQRRADRKVGRPNALFQPIYTRAPIRSLRAAAVVLLISALAALAIAFAPVNQVAPYKLSVLTFAGLAVLLAAALWIQRSGLLVGSMLLLGAWATVAAFASGWQGLMQSLAGIVFMLALVSAFMRQAEIR